MRVGSTLKLTGLLIAAAVALGACASLQRSWDQGNTDMIVGLLNDGQSQKLSSMSATPFLVDGEIVAMKADVASFWSGIVKAGFRVEGASLSQATPLDNDSYKRFADTMEVKSFFAQYVKKDARILELRTTVSADRILLLIGGGWPTKTIYGFKGPF